MTLNDAVSPRFSTSLFALGEEKMLTKEMRRPGFFERRGKSVARSDPRFS